MGSLGNAATAEEVARREIAEGAVASVMHGRRLGLEVTPPPGAGGQRFLQNYLAIESSWVAYRSANRSFIPFDQLKAETQREILLAVYPNDFVDEHGWWHTVVDDAETLFSLCEWLTGRGLDQKAVQADPRNKLPSSTIKRGQAFLIPLDLLRGAMKRPTPKPVVEAIAEATEEVAPPSGSELRHGSDKNGAYATYRLRRGEALYTAVVARFTDYVEAKDILEACEIIAKRSGIRDVHDINAGATITIPAEMLSDQYLPEGSERKQEYLASLRESERLRATQARSRDLSDVVVILDPGHGGADPGSLNTKFDLYEDEINYDIVCRIRAKLEAETDARVYMTLRDKSQGFEPADAKTFSLDKDEEVLTNPSYRGEDPSVSVNLRYMLANKIYQHELDRGVDSRKIVFTSIHTDSLHPRLRGTMIYLPGAQYRREIEHRTDAVYARYEEGRGFNRFTSTSSERRTDEAISRNFALVVLDQLGKHRIKRHDHGDPIRSQIHRAREKPFVPGVIRNCKVPTKVLVETGNLQNQMDAERLADPWWRQQFAEAYVAALKVYFGAQSDADVITARAAD